VTASCSSPSALACNLTLPLAGGDGVYGVQLLPADAANFSCAEGQPPVVPAFQVLFASVRAWVTRAARGCCLRGPGKWLLVASTRCPQLPAL
jgi:hypothetical protein